MIEKIPLTEEDYALIEAAQKEFDKPRKHDWHGVASAIRLQSGKIITGLVLESQVPALTICAEPITIGKALDDIPKDPIKTIVAVRNREETSHKVIPPCGRCREFITDYVDQDCHVIIYDSQNRALFKTNAFALLPFKYKRC
jgi:cytidine deaminase